MVTTTVTPVQVQVTDTPHKAAVLAGGDAALGDGSDATYGEQWLTVRASIGNGPTLIARFDAVPALDPILFRMRFEVANEIGANGTRFIVVVYDTLSGSEVGWFSLTEGAPFVEVPATGTIYDYTDWFWTQAHPSLTLADALNNGGEIRARRLEGAPALDADYMLRVYEMGFIVTTEGPTTVTEPVTRLYPRDDALGPMGSATRLYPPPRRGRIVGGQP